MTLDSYLKARPGRCAECGFHIETQGCACAGNRLKFAGQQAATDAHPDDRARVEAAIRQLAATGQVFSANDARKIHGVKGGVPGATFTALRQGGVIRPVGDEISTGGSAHGHRIYRWIGVAA